MKQEIADLWTKALESGQYAQTTGILHKKTKLNDSFCCLGVLCDLARRENVVSAHSIGDDDYVMYGKEQAVAQLPAEVFEWAGIKTDGDLLNELVHLNDFVKVPFVGIAEFIRLEKDNI